MRLLLFFTVLLCKGIFAQPVNLVPNPGFETFSTCPYYPESPEFSGAQQICFASPWFQPLDPVSPEN